MIEKQWGVLVIQKIARGYIARKTVVRALKIRSTLSGPVLHLAERYMKSGDMWGFLREVEQSLGRLHREIRENEVREDAMASTFVEKVLVQRKADFDGAWGTFSKVVAEGANPQMQQNGRSPWDDTTAGAAATITSHPLLRKQSSVGAGAGSGASQGPRSRQGSRGGGESRGAAGASAGGAGRGRKAETTSDVISAVGPLPDLTHQLPPHQHSPLQHPQLRPMTGMTGPAGGVASPSSSGRYRDNQSTHRPLLPTLQSAPPIHSFTTTPATLSYLLPHPLTPPSHPPLSPPPLTPPSHLPSTTPFLLFPPLFPPSHLPFPFPSFPPLALQVRSAALDLPQPAHPRRLPWRARARARPGAIVQKPLPHPPSAP